MRLAEKLDWKGLKSVWFDIQESVRREIIMKATNEMQIYKLIYYF